jgi:translation elongation factor EF-Tu-like GTPase
LSFYVIPETAHEYSQGFLMSNSAPPQADQLQPDEQPFYMIITKTFAVRSRPIVIVIGRVSSGTLQIGDVVCLSDGDTILDAVVASVEGSINYPAARGDNIAVHLTDVDAAAVKRGMMMTVLKKVDD